MLCAMPLGISMKMGSLAAPWAEHQCRKGLGDGALLVSVW